MATLHFKGKSFVQNHHLTVKYHHLVPDKAASLTAKVSLHDNLIVHGDNLIALKALLPTYAGKVKCIYIDPPYNTGNEDWVYNDNVNSPMLQEWLGKVVDKEDLSRHDKWLCMMMPRLKLLWELLHEEGVIFISIDDREVHHLRMLMDEIFQEENFIAQLVWEKGRKNDAKLFSVGHEYMVVYSRSLATLRQLGTVWREPQPGAKEIWDEYCRLREIHGEDDKAIGNALQEWYEQLPKQHPSKALSRYKNVDKWGPWRDDNISWPGGGGPRYDVVHPKTKQPCAVPERGWGFSTPEAMQRKIQLGLVVFREDHTKPPIRKTHLRPIPEELEEDEEFLLNEDDDEDKDEAKVGMKVMPSVIYRQSQVAVKYLRKLMGAKVFNNPKDHEVLARIFRYCTSPSDIILDSFAGSGTTAHAVLALNKEDGGNRRFILVECEKYAKSITAERVKRVIQGLPESRDQNLKIGLGGTFSFFKLGEAIEMESILQGDNLPSYEDLARYVFYTATGEEFNPSQIDLERNYIGEGKQYEVYLLYKPNLEYLKTSALNLETVEKMGDYKGKIRMVFAPMKYLDIERLQEYRIEYCQLPFEIYKLRD
ncbi:site-specific DNA-methyltransferase [Coleofasciculus sp. FACHB-542]|uniref:site-specific DNA-methyltransferase n=1 Tax=Coleofasciculus sp. FACHB-542 TaxID=2692787 RepID=UPI00168343B9|nr:site-specific DNA-methyltransferase [Coleofasciculus sp. FACHB-542]MBD2085144.1 site-specific DNA-methyltransferase [Coleofasciculus sp. FACHB-542]